MQLVCNSMQFTIRVFYTFKKIIEKSLYRYKGTNQNTFALII